MDNAIRLFANRTAEAPQELHDVETWTTDGCRWVSGLDKDGDSISWISLPDADDDDETIRACFMAAGFLAQQLRTITV